ncbi:MAG TPA: PAS domain-containing protein [Longimicrobium sp.]|nr:PAS domain-containing protein [Longimicrobium sp.]
MADFRSLTDFLDHLDANGSPNGGAHAPTPQHDLLERTIEELRVAVEELRVTQEELASEEVETETVRRRELEESWRFHDVVTAAPFPVALTDAFGAVLYANVGAAALLGVPVQEIPGKPLAVYVAEESRRGFRRMLNEMARDARARTVEITLQPRGRLPLEVEARVWPVPQGGGMTYGWWLTDVTARRAADAARTEQQGVARMMIDSLPVAVAAMDLDGSVLAWNRAASELLGWSEEDLAGRPNPAVVDEGVLDAARASGEPVRATAQAETRDGGSLPVELTLAPMVDAAGKVRGSVSLIRPADTQAEGRGWTEAEMRRVLLSSATAGSLADRLRAGIAAGLHAGYLRPGDRLPSIRDAAQETSIDHRVVSAAYRRLATAGLVEVRYRRGVRVAALPHEEEETQLNETADWLAGVVDQAAALQVRVPGLPDLMRRWTQAVPIRCVCVEGTADGRAALCHELSSQWGMESVPVDPAAGAEARRELAHALRDADLVVTTHYHVHDLAAACAALRKPLVLARLSPEVVQAVEEWVQRGPLTAVVADPAYGERLRALAGGAEIRVVDAADRAAVDALDADTPVLLTLAAQQQVSRRLRLLVPPAHFLSPVSPRTVARLLVRANVSPRRPPDE